jgi:LPXTG-site transpeptidase (sortase) family protein
MTSRSAQHFLRLSLVVGSATGLGLWGWATAERMIYQHWDNPEFTQSVPGPPAQPAITANSPIGRIEISRLGVNTLVREGTGAAILQVAAGHIPGTALPGEKGNVAVAAHRDTLFRGLRNVRKEDSIVFQTANGTHLYRVESTEVVQPDDVAVLKPGRENELTLVTCYPFTWIGSAPQRFIVKAVEVNGKAPVPTIPTSESAKLSQPITPPSTTQPGTPPPSELQGRRVYFQISVNHNRELAPGISLGIASIDADSHTADGWIWLMPERRTVWLRQRAARDPLRFTGGKDTNEHTLVITGISADKATGYLQMQSPAGQRVGASAYSPTTSAGTSALAEGVATRAGSDGL